MTRRKLPGSPHLLACALFVACGGRSTGVDQTVAADDAPADDAPADDAATDEDDAATDETDPSTSLSDDTDVETSASDATSDVTTDAPEGAATADGSSDPEPALPSMDGAGGAGTAGSGGGAGTGGSGGGAGGSGGGAGGTATTPMECIRCEEGFQCFVEVDPGRCLEICATATPSVTLSSQQEVDALAALECEVIARDLIIGGQSIESLDGLQNIRAIVGILGIQATLLEDLMGLDGLLFLGEEFGLIDNTELTTISALANVIAPGVSIELHDNVVLETLDGLQGFSDPASILLTNNFALTNVSALSPTTLGSLHISGNLALRDVRFERLHTIEQGLLVSGETACERLEFPLLDDVGGDILISANPAVLEINLSSLSRAGSVNITTNEALTALDMSQFTGADSVAIAGNPNLPQCEVDTIAARIGGCESCTQNNLEATCD